jgi:hypothetical protein
MDRDLLFWSVDVPIVQAGDPTFHPPLRGIKALATGNVRFVTAGGQTVDYPVPFAGDVIPYFIKQVLNTGTDIADANLKGGR